MPGITDRELRAVYRLVVEVCQLGHDAEAWTTRLMRGLAELFDAKVIGLAWSFLPDQPGAFDRPDVELHYGMTPEQERFWVESYRAGDGSNRAELLRRVINIQARFVTVRRQDVMSDDEWYSLPETQNVHRAVGIDANLTSFFVASSMRRLFGIGVHRAWGRPQFTQEDKRRLRVLHIELARAWRTRVAVPRDDPAILNLPTRLQQVLWLLCLGRSEKEIARQLQISPFTVHNHVRRLHSLFSVRSRAELVARALTRPGSVPPLALPGREMNRFTAS